MEENVSKPEPPPRDEGVEVTPLLLMWLELTRCESEEKRQTLIRLIEARDLFGFRKYGQRLKTNDGRNTLEDAKQEFGDLMQYIFKAKINKEDVSEIQSWIPFLIALLNAEI